jgi:Rieske Fe-S protein
MPLPRLTRRSLARGSVAAAVAALAGAVWARAAYSDDESAGGANSYGPSTEGSDRLIALADVPEGGGVVIEDASVVVVRDADGVRAFSAVCTHQGCLVGSVQDGSIACPCHGSVFDSATGEVTQGPATQSLAEVAVKVEGDAVVRG